MIRILVKKLSTLLFENGSEEVSGVKFGRNSYFLTLENLTIQWKKLNFQKIVYCT